MDLELAKVLGSGGVAAALLFLIYLVGMRLVSAITKIGDRMDKHSELELAHHAKVSEAIGRLDEKIDSAIMWGGNTPTMDPADERRSGPVQGPYAIHRPKTSGR